MRTDRPQYDVVNRWRSVAVLGGSPARVHARPGRKGPLARPCWSRWPKSCAPP